MTSLSRDRKTQKFRVFVDQPFKTFPLLYSHTSQSRHASVSFDRSPHATDHGSILNVTLSAGKFLVSPKYHSQASRLTWAGAASTSVMLSSARETCINMKRRPNGPDTWPCSLSFPHRAVHDIATPKRMIGGRCRKWCISAQPTSDKRRCAACSLCGQQFSHAEPRHPKWSNRQTNNHYVNAHCVNGGLGHDHEVHPKQAGDQEAPPRETIIWTAADTEILLPFAQDPDLASTAAAPDDEQGLFGREEALRTDEEIMNFQWFDNVTWDSIKDLRGTTYVQPPPRFKFALQQAQHAILRAIIHNNPSSLASRASLESSRAQRLLLGRPAVNASESPCAHYLDARLDLFWAEDWSALWTMVRAECDVAPVQNATRRTATEQKQSRIRRLATLARAGEKGRALAAARNAPPFPVTEQIVQEIKSLHPTDPEPPAPRTGSCVKPLPVRGC